MKLLDVMTAPWAITPAKFAEVQEIYLRHARGQSLSLEELAAMRASSVIKLSPKKEARDPYEVIDGVAVVAIEGVLAKKMNVFMDISGGTSMQLLGQALDQALADPGVHAIVLHIDSPGGSVDGTQELARQIVAMRGHKPVVAYADGLMASAAYWIGAAADRVYMSGDTTAVGSIGVVATHVDVSKLEEARGMKTTEIVAGKFKRVASNYAPLSEIGRATIQEQVDHIYSVFVQNVADFRGVTPETVLNHMADGRLFLGAQAVANGLVDGQQSLDALIRELATRHQQGGRMSGTTVVASTITQDQMDEAVKQARAAGQETGHATGKAEGITLGIAQERERLKGIDELGLKGPADLIMAAKYGDPIDASELSRRVVKADQELRTRMERDFHASAPHPVPHANAPAEPTATVDAAELSVAIQAKVDEAAKQGRRLSYTDAKNQVMSERRSAKQ